MWYDINTFSQIISSMHDVMFLIVFIGLAINFTYIYIYIYIYIYTYIFIIYGLSMSQDI